MWQGEEGLKLAKNSVTYFMGGPLLYVAVDAFIQVRDLHSSLPSGWHSNHPLRPPGDQMDDSQTEREERMNASLILLRHQVAPGGSVFILTVLPSGDWRVGLTRRNGQACETGLQ